MASDGSLHLIYMFTSSARGLQCLEVISPISGQRELLNLGIGGGGFTMAELVVASGKPGVEWRELISAGRVEPLAFGSTRPNTNSHPDLHARLPRLVPAPGASAGQCWCRSNSGLA